MVSATHFKTHCSTLQHAVTRLLLIRYVLHDGIMTLIVFLLCMAAAVLDDAIG